MYNIHMQLLKVNRPCTSLDILFSADDLYQLSPEGLGVDIMAQWYIQIHVIVMGSVIVYQHLARASKGGAPVVGNYHVHISSGTCIIQSASLTYMYVHVCTYSV